MRPRRYAKIAALSKLRRPVVAAVVSDGCHGQTSERSRIPAFLRTSAEAGKLHDHARRGGRAARYRRARAEEARRSYRCNAGDRELHRAVRHHARRTLLARADRRRGPHLRHHGDQKERTLPPSITFNGKPYQWTKTLPDDVRGALFEAFTSGESVKRFIAMPKDTARCALTIARLERETGAVYADPHLEELAISRDQKRRGVETRCLNVATGTVHACRTPGRRCAAGDVHPDAPEKPHLCVPQALTQPSRKAHPGSWRPSPKRPGCPHRHFPQILTHAPRKGSPAAPAGAHQPFPGRLTACSCIGSPSAPVSTHPNLPGEAH